MLTPDALFAICNSVALAAWAALALSMALRRGGGAVRIATGIVLPGLFAMAYAGALAAGLAGGDGGGFGSIAEVRTLFANDHALAAGWIHYLAFDLVVGTLIARDAVRHGQRLLALPVLALTFLFGPAGLLAWLVIRLASGGRLSESLT